LKTATCGLMQVVPTTTNRLFLLVSPCSQVLETAVKADGLVCARGFFR
jgi:hypothetical protein